MVGDSGNKENSELSDAQPGETANEVDSLTERVKAVEAFIGVAARFAVVGDLKWPDVAADYRLLAINVAFRRQVDSMRAAVALARQDLGHLAVAFVRPSLEDVMYLTFLCQLSREESQALLLLLGKWDGTRSLLAQRAYLGDDIMQQLWYPPEFLDAAQRKTEEVRSQLKQLQKLYRWAGGVTPSSGWIAERAGQKELYDYLHAATSRALHFSAGETMRRGWGDPSGTMTTDFPGFRAHLAEFALDQLWRLHVQTWRASSPLMEAAAINSEKGLQFSDTEPVLNRLLTLGKVPLVHAREWNLGPDGPL